MTSKQRQWLIENGYDPIEYDIDQQGNVVEREIAPQQEVMSKPRAFGTSFAGNLLPAGGAMAASAPFLPLAVANPLVGVPVMMGAGLLGGYGTGKLQQAGLERFAPEALQEMARAETDQPIASWLGGSAPSLLAFKPSLKGIEGLSAPLMRGRDVFTKFDPATTARFVPAAVNVGVNAASAGAGQLVNMSEGGEFSAPRFLADTALGAILANPTKLGRKMGFPSLTPQRGPITRLELTPEPMLGSPMEEAQKLYGSMPEGNVGRPPSVSQVSKADKSAYEAYSGYKEPEPSKSAETLARELYSAELAGPSGKPPSLSTVANADKAAYEAYSGQRPAPAPEVVKNATAAAREVYTRLQGSAEEGPARITQEDLDAASEIAAVRGLKLRFEDLGGGRGKFQLETPDGVPIISIDPNAATRDTAIHEIGHDVFARSVGEGMQKGLLGSVEESPTYKAEYEARINARDEQGNPTHTEQQARDIALEEGLIQRFGEEYPNVKPGEIRKWFNALKASIKDLVGMKLSPEDANAYLRYLTNENVPWKGVAVAKGGEERFSRAKEASRRLTADDMDWDNMGLRTGQRSVNLEDLISGVLTELKMYQEKPNVFREDVIISREPRLLSNEGSWGRAYTTGARNEGHVVIDSALWDAAVANEPGSRERFVNVLKHELGHIDDAPNIGELGAARDERVADEFAARYQRGQQETPEFKNWFGESKVVNEQGEPLTVYHGTSSPEDFNTFRTDTGHNYGPGAYFTPEPIRASGYAGKNEGARVYSTYVKVEKPYIVQSDATVQDLGYRLRQDPANDALMQSLVSRYGDKNNIGNADVGNAWLRSQGYDGIIKQRNRYTEDGFVPEIVEVVAFNPEQIKSALGNKGTFDPSNPDIRYQRGPVGKATDAVKAGVDKTLGEIDQITRRGGIYETVGRSLTRMYNTAQSMFGRSQAIAPEIYKLGDADAIKLTKHLLQEHRTRTRITPAPEITAAYNEWRNIVKRFWVDENNAVGNTIRQGTGMRERLSDEFWLPFHKESDDVRKILSERVGTPEYQKLKDDYVREAMDSYLQQGMNQQAARNKAIADFETERSVILAPFDPSAPATFAGARKPQGRPLPESWGELNFRDLLESYNRRSAKDYAAQMALERSPEVMTALGSQKMHNDQPIPAAILQNTPIISTDPSVQSVLREFSGRPLQTPGKFVRGIGSIASALALQTVSRIGDIGGTVTKPLAYVGLGDYATYMSGMADKLSNWSQLQLRSIESGLNNPNAHQNFRQAISVGDDAGKYMKRFVNSIGSLTLSNKLEKVARTLAQAQGEMIVSINKRKAMTGDKDAVRFLDTLNADWRTTNDTDLAGQFGLLMQGSYDMRQLPAWFLESGAAPYLTWSKWSMGQMNNFRKFAVEPAMQGDFKPLIAQLLVGMAGGGAIEEIQEWLNNKESKAINWSELQSWAEQNEGEIGSDGGQLLTQKLLMMAQKTGTFGFAGDLMLLPVNALVGDTQGVIGAYPALELTTDLAKNIGGALGAIDKGEDVGLVLKRFGKNMIVGKTQVLRVISNWADELENEGAENLRSADRRKQRLFDELNGMSRAGMFPVSYDNLAEQEFERGVIDEETGEEAFELVSRAREEATSREDYASRIRKYKTSQNLIMPSLERQPMKAARYLSWLEGAEEGAGAETMRRYMTREYENKYRKSLIEGMSGLR